MAYSILFLGQAFLSSQVEGVRAQEIMSSLDWKGTASDMNVRADVSGRTRQTGSLKEGKKKAVEKKKQDFGIVDDVNQVEVQVK